LIKINWHLTEEPIKINKFDFALYKEESP